MGGGEGVVEKRYELEPGSLCSVSVCHFAVSFCIVQRWKVIAGTENLFLDLWDSDLHQAPAIAPRTCTFLLVTTGNFVSYGTLNVSDQRMHSFFASLEVYILVG